MTAFIAYQPRGNAASFKSRTSSKSPTAGLPSWVSSRPSLKSPHQETPMGNSDFVEFVDLTAFEQGTVREYLVAREILEPMGHDPAKRGVRIATDSSSDPTDNDQAGDGKKGNNDDGDTDCESEFSDLPSLEDILTQSGKEFGGRDGLSNMAFPSPDLIDSASKEGGRESEGEDRADLSTTTATSVQLGAAPNNPIVLDDDQSVDIHDAATPDDGKITFEIADQANLSGSPPTLSRGSAEPGTDDKNNIPDSLAKYKADNRSGGKEGGKKPHEDDALNSRTLARGEGGNERGGSGIALGAPASVGQIHDIFAEYEGTFGMPRRKQSTARAPLHECPDGDVAAGSIPYSVGQGEPREIADDGVVATEQTAVPGGGDASRGHPSAKEIGNGSSSQCRQENNQQETDTEGTGSQYISTLAGNCHSEGASAATRYPPSPPPRVVVEATRSDPSAGIQGAPNRKRARSSTQLTAIPDNGAPRKRPRRATKETWKAREAREARQTRVGLGLQQCQTSLNLHRKTRMPSVGPGCARGKVDHRVAHIEDVFVGEDGSIQCLITWKLSLIVMENLAGGELQQRCQELFGKRYRPHEL